MTEQSNRDRTSTSFENSGVAIPSFFYDRLSAISSKLGLSRTETIQALFTWTEMGLSLADSLGIEQPLPQAVFESVEKLKQQVQLSHSSSTLLSSDSVQSTSARKNINQNVSLNREQALFQLCSSFEILTQAIVQLDSVEAEPFGSQTGSDSGGEGSPYKSLFAKPSINGTNLSVSRQTPPKKPVPENDPDSLVEKKKDSHSSSSKVKTDAEDESVSARPNQLKSSNGKKKSQRSIESEREINLAINTVMEFNNTPGRSHQDKWYIGIGSIRTLTGRGDKVIRRVLQQREDVDQHHSSHQLDQSHNIKGRDATPINEIISLPSPDSNN